MTIVDAEEAGAPVNKKVKLTEPEIDANQPAVESEKPSRCLCVENVPREYTQNQMWKLLQQHGITRGVMCTRVKKIERRPVAFLEFSTLEQKERAREILSNVTAGEPAAVLSVKEARNFHEPKGKQRGASHGGQEPSAGAQLPEHERLNDKVTPLWRLSYDQQLEKKQRKMGNVLRKFAVSLRKLLPENGRELVREGAAYEWLDMRSSQSFRLLDIVPAPECSRQEYRNKCEFSTGRNERDQVTLGFMLGLYKEGTVAVASPAECLHVAPFAKQIVAWMQTYLEQETDWKVYDRITHEGNWRIVMTRTHLTGDAMVMFQVHSQGKSAQEMQAEKEKAVSYLLQKAQEHGVFITTILWQISDVVNNGVPDSVPMEILHGNGRITEALECLSTGDRFIFEISPLSFFQSNTPACEKLYDVVAQWSTGAATPQLPPVAESTPAEAPISNPAKKIILLDLCCGTGTIGITMSKLERIHKIIGIELCEEALEDAKRNAMRNGLSEDRVEYICDKVENALPKVLEQLKKATEAAQGEEEYEVVAVLDPPRAGVHKTVSMAIRAATFIQRLLYVSCNPDAASQNWIELCRPESKKLQGTPFRLVRSQAVDMFPHTEHCELVLEFQRNNWQAKE